MNPFKRFYYKLLLVYKYGISFNKPVYSFKLFRNILISKVYRLLPIFGIKKYLPRGIDFAVTYACNFKCSHCYAERLKNKRLAKKMPLADYKRVAQEAMSLGIAVFSFQGGEPALLKDLPDILRAFKPKQNHITITTNGSMLTESMLREWARIGVDTIYFSIDSGIAEEHDKFRNHPGSFNKIMQAIGWAQKYGLRVAINTTVSRDNLYTRGFKSILDYSHKHQIMLETIFARPLGNWDGQAEIMLSAEDIAYYYGMRRNYPFVVRDLDNNYGQRGCPAVKEVLYITAYGDVCGCPYNHAVIGNIHELHLGQIIKQGLNNPWYDHYHAECLTALDKDFLEKYLPLLKDKSLIDANDLK